MGKHRLAAVAVISLLLSFVGASFAFAQADQGLTVRPAVIEDNVTPGEAYHFKITITNPAPIERTFTVVTKDISGLDASGQPIFATKGEETSYSLSSWIQVPQAPIVLAAGQSRTVALVAEVPKNVTPGAHFGGVYFESAAQSTGGNGSAISVEVGSVISLQVAGTVVESARIREFSTEHTLYGSPDVVFTTNVENQGNILERPRGLIQITDMFGKPVASIPVNDALAPIFPGSTRAYTTTWKGSGFAIGRYQAIESLSYGSGAKRTISATVSFWVIPLELFAFIIGALLIITLGVYIWVRQYLRKQLRAMGVSPTAKSDDLGYYGRKYNKTGSRLVLIAGIAILLCIVLLVLLFIMFA